MPTCSVSQRLTHDYEAALQESRLYDVGGAASLQQAAQYETAANAAADTASKKLAHHEEFCALCKQNRAP
jgi:hypothetical protein